MVRYARAIAEVERRNALLKRLEEATELPLVFLAFAMIPLLIGPFLWDVSAGEQAAFAVVGAAIWVAFAVDFGMKLIVAPDRIGYLKRNWLQAIIVVLPFFRPLFILRLAVYGSRAFVGVRRLMRVDSIVVFGAGLIFVAATAELTFEQGHNPNIDSFGDALWWAMVTISTVGYGDITPVTVPGRLVALLLMSGGIAFFGVLVGNLTTYLTKQSSKDSAVVESKPDSSVEELTREMRELRAELEKLRNG